MVDAAKIFFVIQLLSNAVNILKGKNSKYCNGPQKMLLRRLVDHLETKIFYNC